MAIADQFRPEAPEGKIVVGAPGAAVSMGQVVLYDTMNFSRYYEIGFGIPGIAGEPRQTGTGQLAEGHRVTLEVENGRPFALAFLVIGFSRRELPIKGGILYPAPDVVVGLPLDYTGSVSVPMRWPIWNSNIELTTQFWVVDPAAMRGFAATKGLRILSPSYSN